MSIRYLDPLSKGFDRMKRALFQPFDMGKWFTVGFTAFLAGLMDGWGRGGQGSSSYKDHASHWEWREALDFPQIAWQWMADHFYWSLLIGFGVCVLIGLGILLIWLSSRGKFMFLHNVANNASQVSQPWHEYKAEGDSLFVWRLVYGAIVFLVMILMVFQFFYFGALFDEYGLGSWMSVLGALFLTLLIVMVLGYVGLFLDSFIVPLMYKNRINAMDAWRSFMPLLSRHFGHLFLYGLFSFFLSVVLVVLIFMAGLFTCCVGFLLLIIPYISTVVLLPVFYTFRAFSLEYLGQFGPEYAIFSE